MKNYSKANKNRGTADSNNGNNKTIWIVSILIIIGLLFIFNRGQETTTDDVIDEIDVDENGSEIDNELSEDVVETPIVISNGEEIDVLDQTAGEVVIINSISFPESRWVVIHEELDGKPGAILGARLFNQEQTEGQVNLLRDTVPGQSYYALVYHLAEREEEQGRVFDRNRDVPLIDESGEVLVFKFQTFSESETDQDQNDSDTE